MIARPTLARELRLQPMIERHYGTLIGGAHAGIAGRLDALEAELEKSAAATAEAAEAGSRPG